MKHIALIGEDPNDTAAIQHLMLQKYKGQCHFFALAQNMRGSSILNDKAIRRYNNRIAEQTPHYVIVIIDADALESEQTKIEKKKTAYKKLEKELHCKSSLLLNIYELEALILADGPSFKKQYGIGITYNGNVMHKEKPKEYLQHITGKNPKKYSPNDCKELFKNLDFETVRKNCEYFNRFIEDFEKTI